MKKIITFIILIGITLIVYCYRKEIVVKVEEYYNQKTGLAYLKEKNEYFHDIDFSFVQNTTNFQPENKQDLYNIYYTMLNSGVDEFSFICPIKYSKCIDDVTELANDQETLSNINNFVHPFNSFKNLETKYTLAGKVTIYVKKLYDDEKIKLINEKVDELSNQLIIDGDSDRENIKRIHDYIVNNNKYDSLRADKNIQNYSSDTAYGPLFEGYAICSGYTDLLSIFLWKMNIKNFKVSSDNHIWNAIYLNDTWLNIDLTWDDPVTSDGSDILEHDYFLISTEKLQSMEITQHSFNQNVYTELN